MEENNTSQATEMYKIITTDGIEDKIPKKQLNLSKVICDMLKDLPDNKDPFVLPINSNMLPILKCCLANNFILHTTKSQDNKISGIKRKKAKNELEIYLSTQANLHIILTFADQQNIPCLLTYCMKLWAKRKYVPSIEFSLPFEVNRNIAKYMKGSKKLFDKTAEWAKQNLSQKKIKLIEKTLINLPNILWSIALSNDNNLIASNHHDYISIYNQQTNQINYINIGQASVNLQFNNDNNNQLWSSGKDGKIKLWDLATNKNVTILESSECRALAFRHIPHYKTLISDAKNYKLCFWNLENCENPKIIDAHLNYISALEASIDGSLCASASYDGFVYVWNTATKEKILSFDHNNTSVRSINFNYEKNKLVCGLDNGCIFLYDLVTLKELCNRKEDLNDNIQSIIFDKNDVLICSGSSDKTIKLWDIRTCKTIKTLFNHYSSIESLAIDHHNKLISGSYNGIIKIWDLRKLVEPIINLRHEISDKCTIEHILKFADNNDKKSFDDPLLTNFSDNTKRFLTKSTYRAE